MATLPHIIIFNPDQWRGDVIGHLGNPAAVTPVLDEAVKADFVSFSHAFCQNPVCTPSRCSFMTGWYPHTRGHRTMFHMLQPDEPMLLKKLKDAGYFVWWGGKNDVVPGQNGYDDYCDVKYQPPDTPDQPLRPDLHTMRDDWRGTPDSDTFFSFYFGKIDNPDGKPYVRDRDWGMVEGAIEQIKNAPPDQPLCIYLPLTFPHPPYAVEDPFYSQIDIDQIPPRVPTPEDWSGKPSLLKGIWEMQHMQTWTEERWQELRRTYYGMCARVDTQFGMVLDALREAGIYDDTAVFFFSDHGDFTGDYGLVEKTQNTYEDCLTHVPFLVKSPKGVPVQPRVTDALVELVDFPATVYDLTGIEPGYTHFGRSLLPLLAGETDSHRDAVFCQGGRTQGEEQAMEKFRELDEHFLYWPRLKWQQSDGPYHTKGTMCRTQDYKYVHRLYEQDELYDLRADPGEQDNRIDDPALADVLRQLKERVMQFYLETSDVVPLEADRRW
ncbi:MAG: sulfatase-like hydrolase/transferase [Anaerolineae bacterium]|nr:sulfatase-like hydrolase/transferase [Anaerolineae bacterium]